MLEFLGQFIIKLIETTGYPGIFVFMALESALIPIPSEITMPFSGFLASTGELSLTTVILVGTIANLVGSLVAYYIGYLIEETILINLIKRYGKFVLVSVDDYQKAFSWFAKYGDKIIFVSRLMPGVRTVISLPAGLCRMDIKKFIAYTFVGCLIWSAFLAYIGYILGENWKILEAYFRKFEIAIAVLLIVAVIWYLERHLGVLKSLRGK